MSTTPPPVVNGTWLGLPVAYWLEDIALIEHVNTPWNSVLLGILIWDCIMYLPQDIKIFRKPRLADWVYLTSRIGALLVISLNVASQLGGRFSSSMNCHIELHALVASYILAVPSVSMLFLLRTAAIWNYNRIILGVLGVCWIGEVACYIMAPLAQDPLNDPFDVPCIQLITKANYFIAAFASSTIFDTLCFILSTSALVNGARFRASGSLVNLLLRDGIIYFAVTFAINVTQLVVQVLPTAPYLAKVIMSAPVAVFPCILSSLMYHHLKQFGGQGPTTVDKPVEAYAYGRSPTFQTSFGGIRSGTDTAKPFTTSGIKVTQDQEVHSSAGIGYAFSSDHAMSPRAVSPREPPRIDIMDHRMGSPNSFTRMNAPDERDSLPLYEIRRNGR